MLALYKGVHTWGIFSKAKKWSNKKIPQVLALYKGVHTWGIFPKAKKWSNEGVLWSLIKMRWFLKKVLHSKKWSNKKIPRVLTLYKGRSYLRDFFKSEKMKQQKKSLECWLSLKGVHTWGIFSKAKKCSNEGVLWIMSFITVRCIDFWKRFCTVKKLKQKKKNLSNVGSL